MMLSVVTKPWAEMEASVVMEQTEAKVERAVMAAKEGMAQRSVSAVVQQEMQAQMELEAMAVLEELRVRRGQVVPPRAVRSTTWELSRTLEARTTSILRLAATEGQVAMVALAKVGARAVRQVQGVATTIGAEMAGTVELQQ